MAGVPTLRSGPLTPADDVALEARWISRDFAAAAMIRRVTSIEGAEIVGREGKVGSWDGQLIPYIQPGESHVREYRLRRDHPDLVPQHDGTLKPGFRYCSPPGKGNMLYFVPGTDPAWLADKGHITPVRSTTPRSPSLSTTARKAASLTCFVLSSSREKL